MVKAEGKLEDGTVVAVDVGFVIVCVEHGSAFGPYNEAEEAAEKAVLMLEAGSKCSLEIMPLLALEDVLGAPARPADGKSGSVWPPAGAYL